MPAGHDEEFDTILPDYCDLVGDFG